MSLLIPRYDPATEVPFERIARALLTADQLDDWLPDPVYYRDQLDEIARVVGRAKTSWTAPNLPAPEVEVLELPRASGGVVPALALPLDLRMSAHAVITLMAPRVTKALVRDKVYGFRFLRHGDRIFDPPGRELDRVFRIVAAAAQAAASGTFEVLDVVAFNATARPERLATTLQQCGARADEARFLGSLAALGGRGLASVDDAFAFAYNFYLQPVDAALKTAGHNFFRYRDEFFVFDAAARQIVVDRARALGLDVRSIRSRDVRTTVDELPRVPDAEETLVRLPYGTLSAATKCSSASKEDCTDYSEVVFRLQRPPVGALFTKPATTAPLDAIEVLPYLRWLNEQRRDGVLLAPPFAGQTQGFVRYRESLAASRAWLGQALATAVQSGSSWQAGWTATLLSDLGLLAAAETDLLQRVLRSAAMAEAAKVQARIALARSSTLPAERFWTEVTPATPYRRRGMLLAARHLIRRARAPWAALERKLGPSEPELTRHLNANMGA